MEKREIIAEIEFSLSLIEVPVFEVITTSLSFKKVGSLEFGRNINQNSLQKA